MDSGYLEDHFAGLAGFYRSDRRVSFGEWESMSDDWRRIEFSGTEKARHLMPRLVHAAADDTVDGQTLEDHFGCQVEIHLFRRNAQHLHATADSHERKGLVEGGRPSRHLQPHVRAEPASCSLHYLLRLIGMNRVVRSHLFCER